MTDKINRLGGSGLTAAYTIYDPQELTSQQQDIMWRILLRVYEIGVQETHNEKAFVSQGQESKGDYRDKNNTRRPQYVFHIDGARGAGKTTMLLTLSWHIRMLGVEEVPDAKEKVDNFLPDANKMFKAVLARSSIETVTNEKQDGGRTNDSEHLHPELRNLNAAKLISKSHTGNGRTKRTACVLPVLFPSDLEKTQSIMEGLFALMSDRLRERIERHEGDRNWAKRKEAEALQRELHETVVKGWFLAKRDGEEAILRDSFDYNDFLERRGKASAESYVRVETWRKYVSRFLDLFDAQLLAVFIDDTDVDPVVTEDILHTARIFLNHSRIVTVIAGHLRSMRQSLMQIEMSTLQVPLSAIGEPNDATAIEWRQFTQHQIEEYLEKVLPRCNRFYLSVPDKNIGKSIKNNSINMNGNGDYKKLSLIPLGLRARARIRWNDQERNEGKAEWGEGRPNIVEDDFDEFCQDRLYEELLSFHKARTGRIRDKSRPIEKVSREDRDSLDRFMSWWLYWRNYGNRLFPQSIRQLRTLERYTKRDLMSKLVCDHLPEEHRKRLAVILFEAPGNYELILRFTDTDPDVMTWLGRQKLEADWRGDGFFSINDRSYFNGTYSYDYLSYRLDLGIAVPIRENPDAGIPRELLPRMGGTNLTGHPPACFPYDPQNKHGVTKRIRHSVVPANCLYFDDLQCLPNVAWHNDSNKDIWDSDLSYEWPNLFYMSDDRERKTDHFIDSSLIAPSSIEQYFIEVVVPLAALVLGRFLVAPLERKDVTWLSPDDWKKKDEEGEGIFKGYSLLLGEVTAGEPNKEPKPVLVGPEERFFHKQIQTIEGLRRQVDYLQLQTGKKQGNRAISHALDDVFKELRSNLVNPLIPIDLPDSEIDPAKLGKLRRYLADYQWLVNDVRKAWHAGRIYLSYISRLQVVPTVEEADDRSSRRTIADTFTRADLYKIVSRDDLRRYLSFKDGTDGDLQHTKLNAFFNRWLTEKIDGDPKRWGDQDFEWRFSLILGQENKEWKNKNPEELKNDLFERAFSEAGLAIVDPWFYEDENDLSDENAGLGGRDPKKHQNRSAILTNNARHVAHHLMMLIWGLGPCLPTLIHIEAASIIRSNPDEGMAILLKSRDQDKKSKREIPGSGGPLLEAFIAWNNWINAFRNFTFRYRIANEIWCLALECGLQEAMVSDHERDWKKDGKSRYEYFKDHFIAPLSPDVSHNTFGLDGQEGLRRQIVKDASKSAKSKETARTLLATVFCKAPLPNSKKNKRVDDIAKTLLWTDEEEQSWLDEPTPKPTSTDSQQRSSELPEFQDIERKLFLAEDFIEWLKDELNGLKVSNTGVDQNNDNGDDGQN